MNVLVTTVAIAVIVEVSMTAETVTTAAVPNCTKNEECGWKASCDTSRSLCVCLKGYLIHANGKDCLNEKCSGLKDCVQCSSADKCVRCVGFISKVSGQCMEKCKGQAEISQEGLFQGNVCTEGGDSTEVVIAVVAGVAAGLLLCVIVGFGICIYFRRTRKNINLQEKHYKSRELEMGKVKQIPVYDNQGFEDESHGGLRGGVIDPDVYLKQLDELKPHTETLMTMLSQIRRKLRSMKEDDPRVPTYKGVIHQLCRVLVLLHKKDPTVSIPSDALGLIEWAQQMLEDHREQEDDDQAVSVGTAETPISKISYIEVDFEPTTSPVYASPSGSGQAGQPLSSTGTSGYYSSVPVPLPDPHQAGYATINRTPTNPSSFNKNVSKSGSMKNVSKGRSGSSTNAGYFANGRYYDPSPQPVVYAPASSYSDRSAGPLSTFTGDLQRSRSFSASNNSNSGSDGGDDKSSLGPDGFPFDPRDATDPVEV